MDYMNDLHDICDTLGRTLKEANTKLRDNGGKMTAGDVDYIEKLTHAIKSIKATIAMMEAEEDDDYSERYSRNGSYRRGYSRNRGSYDDGSYARGRGARRDSMGRYSRDGGYSGNDFADELRDLMDNAPDDHTRQEMQRLLQKMEQR